MLLETIWQDLRVGARVLIKDKSFCAIAVGVLALGICGVATQLGVINGVLWRGFSFPDAHQLVNVGFADGSRPQDNNDGPGGMAAEDYAEFVAGQQSFSATAAFLNGSTINVSEGGRPRRYQGGYVEHDFFRLIGVAPVLGRDFTPEDDRPGASKVVLLSHSAWQGDFGGERSVIGRSITLNGRPATIIGVMPPRFNFPVNEQLWVPLRAEFPPRLRGDRQEIDAGVLARLRPDVSLDQAALEADTIAKRLAAAHPATNERRNLGRVRPLLDSFIGDAIRQMLGAMLGAVGFVLLIACLNVMNMQFARATLRARELAIRGALGASRGRLVRQMLTETLLVAGLGATVGVLGAYWATDALMDAMRSLTFPIPYFIQFQLDGRVLALVVAITVGAALIAGLLPALLASRANAADVLKESGRGNTSRLVRRLTQALVVAQVALTCVLLVASIFQVQSIRYQTNLDFGYQTDAVYSARLGLFDGSYPQPADRALFYDRLLRELRASGEFSEVALTQRMRMLFAANGRMEIDGQAYVQEEDRPEANWEPISPGYFATLGLRILEGRDFNADDSDTRQPVTVVNAAFARKYFGTESPLGRRLRIHNRAAPDPWRTIIGVVPDTLMQGPFNQQRDRAGFYVPLTSPVPPQFVTVVVRPPAGQRAEALERTLQQAVSRVDPDLPLYFVGTPARLHDEQLAQLRVVSSMFTIFGCVGVILASVGLYGVMAFSVNQRTQEFGVRLALGAGSGRILAMVLRQGGMQLALGLGVGLVVSWLAVGLGVAKIQGFFFGINPHNPLVYGGVSLLLGVVALVACLAPARRALRVDPIIALRAD